MWIIEPPLWSLGVCFSYLLGKPNLWFTILQSIKQSIVARSINVIKIILTSNSQLYLHTRSLPSQHDAHDNSGKFKNNQTKVKNYYLCSDLNDWLWFLENNLSLSIFRNLLRDWNLCQIYRTSVYDYEAFTCKIWQLSTL